MKAKRRASLQCAGGDHGPEPFVGPAAVGATRALGDVAVDDDEADRLLGDVVGRVHAGGSDECEIRLGMLAEALGHVLRLASVLLAVDIDQAGRLVAADANDVGLGLCEGGSECVGGQRVMLMDDVKQCLEGAEQLLAVGARRQIGQGGQELDIANEVRDAELHGDLEVLHELAIGREVIAAQGPLEFLSQDLDQDLRAA